MRPLSHSGSTPRGHFGHFEIRVRGRDGALTYTRGALYKLFTSPPYLYYVPHFWNEKYKEWTHLGTHRALSYETRSVGIYIKNSL